MKKRIIVIISCLLPVLAGLALGIYFIVSRPPDIAKVEITNEIQFVNTGESFTLDLSITPSNANPDEVIWYSSDIDIATVNQSGVVTPKKDGEVTITVVSKKNSKISASITFTVRTQNALLNMPDRTVQYDGNQHTTSVTTPPDGAVLSYSYVGILGTNYPTTDIAPKNVGDYSVRVNLEGSQAYSVAFLKITPRPAVIIILAATKVFHDADPVFGILNDTPSGLVGTDTITFEFTRKAGEDVGAYAISILGAVGNSVPVSITGNANYSTTFVGANLNITKRTVKIVIENCQSIYGDPVSGYARAFTICDLEGDPLDIDLSNVTGNLTVSATGIRPNAGTYEITGANLRSDNLTFAIPAKADYVITKRVVRITPRENQGKYAGDADPTLLFDVSNNIVADGHSFTGILNRLEGEVVDTYAYGLDDTITYTNYQPELFVTDLLVFAIRPNEIEIRLSDIYTDYSLGYSTLQKNELVYTVVINGISSVVALDEDDMLTLKNGDRVKVFPQTGTEQSMTSSEIAVYYKILDIKFQSEAIFEYNNLDDDARYNINYYTLTRKYIKKLDLIVSAESLNKVYGESDPTLTFSIDGLYDTDTNSVISVSLLRRPGENVGKYDIYLANHTLNAGYYKVIFNSAIFEITKRALTITADNITVFYGNTAKALTYTSEGLLGSDSIGGNLTREAGFNVRYNSSDEIIGYEIYGTSLIISNNYDIVFVGATYTINPRTIDVTPIAFSITYGQTSPILNYETEVDESEESFNSTLFKPTATGALSVSYGTRLTAGVYPIQLGTLNFGRNFEIRFNDEKKLTVDKLEIEISFTPITFSEEDDFPTPKPRFTQLASGVIGLASGDEAVWKTLFEADYVIEDANYRLTLTKIKDSLDINFGNLTVTDSYTITLSDSQDIVFYKSASIMDIEITMDVNKITFGNVLNLNNFGIVIANSAYADEYYLDLSDVALLPSPFTFTKPGSMSNKLLPADAGNYTVGIVRSDLDKIKILRKIDDEPFTSSFVLNISSYGYFTIDKATLEYNIENFSLTNLIFDTKVVTTTPGPGEANTVLYYKSGVYYFDGALKVNAGSFVFNAAPKAGVFFTTTRVYEFAASSTTTYPVSITFSPDDKNFSDVLLILYLTVERKSVNNDSSRFTYEWEDIDNEDPNPVFRTLTQRPNTITNSNPEVQNAIASISYTYFGFTYNTNGSLTVVDELNAKKDIWLEPLISDNNANRLRENGLFVHDGTYYTTKFVYELINSASGSEKKSYIIMFYSSSARIFLFVDSDDVTYTIDPSHYITPILAPNAPANPGFYIVLSSLVSANNYTLTTTSFIGAYEIFKGSVVLTNVKEEFEYLENLIFTYSSNPVNQLANVVGYKYRVGEIMGADFSGIPTDKGEYYVILEVNNANYYHNKAYAFKIKEATVRIVVESTIFQYRNPPVECTPSFYLYINTTLIGSYNSTTDVLWISEHLQESDITLSYFGQLNKGTKYLLTNIAPSNAGTYYLIIEVSNSNLIGKNYDNPTDKEVKDDQKKFEILPQPSTTGIKIYAYDLPYNGNYTSAQLYNLIRFGTNGENGMVRVPLGEQPLVEDNTIVLTLYVNTVTGEDVPFKDSTIINPGNENKWMELVNRSGNSVQIYLKISYSDGNTATTILRAYLTVTRAMLSSSLFIVPSGDVKFTGSYIFRTLLRNPYPATGTALPDTAGPFTPSIDRLGTSATGYYFRHTYPGQFEVLYSYRQISHYDSNQQPVWVNMDWAPHVVNDAGRKYEVKIRVVLLDSSSYMGSDLEFTFQFNILPTYLSTLNANMEFDVAYDATYKPVDLIFVNEEQVILNVSYADSPSSYGITYSRKYYIRDGDQLSGPPRDAGKYRVEFILLVPSAYANCFTTGGLHASTVVIYMNIIPKHIGTADDVKTFVDYDESITYPDLPNTQINSNKLNNYDNLISGLYSADDLFITYYTDEQGEQPFEIWNLFVLPGLTGDRYYYFRITTTNENFAASDVIKFYISKQLLDVKTKYPLETFSLPYNGETQNYPFEYIGAYTTDGIESEIISLISENYRLVYTRNGVTGSPVLPGDYIIDITIQHSWYKGSTGGTPINYTIMPSNTIAGPVSTSFEYKKFTLAWDNAGDHPFGMTSGGASISGKWLYTINDYDGFKTSSVYLSLSQSLKDTIDDFASSLSTYQDLNNLAVGSGYERLAIFIPDDLESFKIQPVTVYYDVTRQVVTETGKAFVHDANAIISRINLTDGNLVYTFNSISINSGTSFIVSNAGDSNGTLLQYVGNETATFILDSSITITDSDIKTALGSPTKIVTKSVTMTVLTTNYQWEVTYNAKIIVAALSAIETSVYTKSFDNVALNQGDLYKNSLGNFNRTLKPNKSIIQAASDAEYNTIMGILVGTPIIIQRSGAAFQQFSTVGEREFKITVNSNNTNIYFASTDFIVTVDIIKLDIIAWVDSSLVSLVPPAVNLRVDQTTFVGEIEYYQLNIYALIATYGITIKPVGGTALGSAEIDGSAPSGTYRYRFSGISLNSDIDYEINIALQSSYAANINLSPNAISIYVIEEPIIDLGNIYFNDSLSTGAILNKIKSLGSEYAMFKNATEVSYTQEYMDFLFQFNTSYILNEDTVVWLNKGLDWDYTQGGTEVQDGATKRYSFAFGTGGITRISNLPINITIPSGGEESETISVQLTFNVVHNQFIKHKAASPNTYTYSGSGQGPEVSDFEYYYEGFIYTVIVSEIDGSEQVNIDKQSMIYSISNPSLYYQIQYRISNSLSYSSSKYVNANQYVAQVYYNHSSDRSFALEFPFEISKANRSFTLPAQTFIVGKTSQTIGLTPMGLPDGVNVSFTYDGSPVVPTTAGSYFVVATIEDENYYGQATSTLNIIKDSPVISDIVLPDHEFNYRDVSVGFVAKNINGTNITGNAYVVYHNLSNGEVYNTNGVSEAGSYEATITYPGDATTYNHVEVVVYFTIRAAEAIFDIQNLTVSYTTAAQPLNVTVSGSSVGISITYNNSSSAPINAGSYTAVIIFAGNLNFKPKTETVVYTILPKEIIFKYMNEELDGVLRITYGAAGGMFATSPTNTPSSEYDIKYHGYPYLATSLNLGAAIDLGSTQPTLPGVYTATITPKTGVINYAGIVIKNIVISKRDADITITGEEEYVAGDPLDITVINPHELSLEFIYTGTMLYGSPYYSMEAPNNAGNYVMMVSFDGDTLTASFFGLKNITILEKVDEEDPDEELVNYTISGLMQVYNGSAKQITIYAVDFEETPLTVDTITYNDSAILPINAGIYIVVISFVEDFAPITVTMEILKAKQYINYTLPSLIYDGNHKRLTGLSALGGISVNTPLYSVVGGIATGSDYTQAGEYIVELSVDESTNYEGLTITVKYVIEKATPVIEYTLPSSFVHGQVTAIVATCDSGTVLIAVGGVTGNIGPTTAVGTHTITMSATSTANYNSVSITITIHIIKATPTISVAEIPEFTYDTYSKSINSYITVTTGAASPTIIYYQGVNQVTPINAGEYKVVITVAENSSYLGTSLVVWFTIGKRQVTIGPWSNTITEYSPSITVPSFNFVGQTCLYTRHYTGLSYNSSGTLNVAYDSVNMPTVAGVYTITITLDNNHYTLSSLTSSFIINKATATIEIELVDDNVYSGSVKNFNVTSSHTGVSIKQTIKKLVYNVDTSSWEYQTTGNILDAGSYLIECYITEQNVVGFRAESITIASQQVRVVATSSGVTYSDPPQMIAYQVLELVNNTSIAIPVSYSGLKITYWLDKTSKAVYTDGILTGTLDAGIYTVEIDISGNYVGFGRFVYTIYPTTVSLYYNGESINTINGEMFVAGRPEDYIELENFEELVWFDLSKLQFIFMGSLSFNTIYDYTGMTITVNGKTLLTDGTLSGESTGSRTVENFLIIGEGSQSIVIKYTNQAGNIVEFSRTVIIRTELVDIPDEVL